MSSVKFISKLIYTFTFILFFVPLSNIIASENFTTEVDAVYSISENSSTTVNLEITLTNTTESKFPESFHLNLGFNDIGKLSIKDEHGPIDYILEKSTNGYILKMNFNKKPIGKNKKTKVQINFSTKSVLEDQGGAKKILIPAISNLEQFEKFDVQISVPKSFGEISFSKPQSDNLIFTKSQLESGISIGYGASRTYSIDLNYNLRNRNLYPKTMTIAIPSDTSYQQVYLDNIEPRPRKIIFDQDGNMIAHYFLMPLGEIQVKANGLVTVNYKPEQGELSNNQKIIYTSPTNYWPSDDHSIESIAKELKTPRNIYNFVVDKLNYDISRVDQNKLRLGAKKALKNPDSAVCLEFTDLFIGLARASGIPAREINGYVYTKNDGNRPSSLIADVLHSWPEYYDSTSKSWIMIDPTWGNTTSGLDYFENFDYDHISFVTKGVRDDLPIPAGGYKSKGQEDKKDVKVQLSERSIPQEIDIVVIPDIETQYIAGLPINMKAIVKNQSGLTVPESKLIVESKELTPRKQGLTIKKMPPFSQQSFLISFDNKNILTNNTQEFTIQIGQKTSEFDITIKPFYGYYRGGVLIGIFTIFIFFITWGSRRVLISRQRR